MSQAYPVLSWRCGAQQKIFTKKNMWTRCTAEIVRIIEHVFENDIKYAVESGVTRMLSMRSTSFQMFYLVFQGDSIQ